ncbi:ectopic P granules protein 5 homolog isoform X1 [Acanthochromis polyacanthus]|uniref:ectopic P granules protein 5 homolog isoform X1 n=1 Tax=Acanthochromis polyacanthus TaxID=80966 RepID=UPI002234C60A|nr:ectopic P granules protein 5 homolog isoform X1 [Acanthochromis polyacanthus]XP_051806766.1 ectopic P granules protein 5 homolog isoform X1 [Acanthochromis polyacanthus]
MEAVRPKKTKSKSSGKSQQVRKQKQAEEDKRATAPSAVCDEASTSGFTDIPLSLPFQEPEEEQQDSIQTLEITAQPSDQPSQKQQTSSSQTLSTSVLTQPVQSNVNLPTETSQVTVHLTESKREDEKEGGLEAQGAELKDVPQTTGLGTGTQSWTQPCLSTQFEVQNVPTAPALYPSLPTLEEGPVMELCDEAVKNCAKEPAVLALPEQESSPPSLHPVEFVAELSRSKLYPELPKTAPEMQPFTLEQLTVWEPGGGLRAWLEGVEVCAAQFCALARQENHELTELLQNYWRCRRQLTQSHTQLHTQSSDCKSTQNRLWSFRDEQLTLQGVCADQSKVCGYHRFQQADFSQSVLAELRRLFEACSELLHQKVVLHAYTALLSRLQVESYLYRLLKDCSGSKTQPCSLQPLKEAISVLFSFTRRVLDDTQFQTDIHHWLDRLVAVLLRVGGSGEHLYLLCHLLCCPAGVGKWAAPFLQIQLWGNTCGVQQFMQALAILMSPARHRMEFLGHMKPCESQSSTNSGPESGNWTLVDEGGEEDEDPESSWLLLCEEDLISLLTQFPFQHLYSHMLGMSKQGVYEPQACSSQKMMRVFAFASSLIEILALGLQTYNRARYRQLVKRIGHIIRMTVCYVSDHWAQYVSVTDAGGSSSHSLSLDKLQLEYDHVFLRAVLHVLRNKRLGIWLFMSEMPYGTLSSSMLWKVLYVMQRAETAGLETLSTSDTNSCIQALRDPKHQEGFEQWLCEVNSSDGISLLTALAHMATPTQHSDPAFITTITLLIYQVSYVSMSTRETYSKVGRELLAAIATAHPYVISVLLERLRETIQTVGMVALYLCKELPLSLWQPRPEEICVIGAWLLQHPLSAVENRLACVILEGLNWGYTQDGSLALPSFLHSEVALLVAEAYQKYLTDKPYSGLISEGIKQVSYLASVLRLGVSPEASFSQWAWQLLLRLKLHGNAQNAKGAWAVPALASNPPPELTHSPSMHSVLRAVKAGIPIGCYLSIAMTTVGHSLEHFCTDGVGLLKSLIQSRHLRAAVHLLDNILPPTYPLSYYLLNNAQFVSCIQLFLQYDSVCPQGVTQQVTHRVAPLLTGTTYGDNVRLLNSVIQSHVVESAQPGRVGAAAVLEFWVGILTQQNLWYRDKTVLFLMDQICCAAFTHHQEDCVQKLLYQQHKNALGYHGDRGLLSSLVGWIAGNATPSFIEGQSLSAEVWFAWLVLNMEGVFEEDSQLRRCVEHELLSEPNIFPEQALKKVQQRLKLPVAPSLQRLQVYRWACQAVATPPDHPLLPLIWQKFLQLYLRQPGPEYGLAAGGCIGRRFFQASSHAALLRDLRQRIQEVSDFHHAASQALRVPPPHTPSSDTQSDESPNNPQPPYLTSPQLHTELVRLFGVFAVWLDDETLQKQEVYVPSLPPEYDPHRLAQVMQRQQELWLEYMDQERLQYDEREVLALWEKVQSEPTFLQTQNPGLADYTSLNNARERIMSNLQKHPVPQSPPELQQHKAPVPEVPTACLTDCKAAAELLQQDLSILQDQARIAVAREAQQVAMEQELLESLPVLFKNRPEQVSMALECKGKGGQPCQGPANITVTCERVQRQESVQTQITSLRRDIKKLQTDAMAPPPQILAQAAVHTENFITTLVNMHKAQKSLAVQQVGVSAFYTVVSFVCEDTLRHPPTRQYLSSCVEILGQVFIQGNAEECGHVLKTILEQRRLCPLISPFFTPNAAPNQLVFLYQDVVTSLHLDSADVIFMLLTKFDLSQWLHEAHPVFSERTRLLELVHGALCVCGRDPEPELLTPFHLFTKHWTWLLRHHFPDHYSDCLRLLMTSSSNQLLSPECWKVTLRVLGCLPPSRSTKSKAEQPAGPADVPGRAVGPPAAPYRSSISLSPQQVDETVHWLSDYFLRSRLSKPDLRSFGLYSAWTPYIADVVSFWDHLIGCLINVQLSSCARESVGSSKVMKALQDLHSKIVKLFKAWVFPLDSSEGGNVKCYPWLETDASAAGCLVSLYTQLTETLHHKFRDRLLPGQRGALWLCLMQYCESCTSPRTPEYLLYLYHTHLRSLPWRHLHPDTQLMQQLFNVERGSPKSCFLFMGEVLCEVNWVSVLSDHLQTPPSSTTYPTLPDMGTPKESHTMLVYLLYMLVFLAKEEQLLTQQDSPLLSLLVQSTSLPWHQLDLSSYQSILGYVSTHYPSSLLLSADSAPQLLLKSLRSAAGLHPRPNEDPHQEETLKAGAYVCWCVQSLVTLEQGGSITLNSLEAQLETLLESVITFNPPEVGLEQRHMAFCSLFSDALALLNGVGVSTGEALAAHVITWLDRKGRGFPILPLLTACSRCLASVRHMTRIMEACITAYFNHAEEESVGWGPVLASLQVPELTVDDFLSESQSGGSFLTLYAFILQRLNSEYTAANERRTLALINTWTTQVFPSGPGDEAKLFLWWHKALNLSAEQLQPQASQTEVSVVVMGLMRLQTRLLQLGEERLNSGLLGAIGFGKRSPVSNRFRVVVRSLAAFLSIQVPSETELRLQPTSDLQLSAKAQQTLGMLEAMPSNKQYAELEDSVNKAVQFIRYPGHCLKDGPRLLALLANLLYPDLRYLHIIR